MFKSGDDIALLEQKVPREATESEGPSLSQEASSGSDARTMEVEQLFRQSKAVFDTCPIFHSSDAAIRGHVFCTFLALLLQKHLNNLASAAGRRVEWRMLLRELDQLSQARMRSSDKDWLIRTDATPDVAAIFRQAHIALPPRARQTLPPKPTQLPKVRRRRGRPPRRSATPS